MMRWILRTSLIAPVVYGAARRINRTKLYFTSHRYPIFVHDDKQDQPLGVPVFTYHSIANSNTPDSVTLSAFETQMRYLAENDYHTISADELLNYLVHNHSLPPKSVMLTFDDGRASIWSTAQMILEKYKLHALVFLVPGTMNNGEPRPTLGDREADSDQWLNNDLSANPVITWDEARLMQARGSLEFQSHTLDHTLIYTQPEIVDFYHPEFDNGFSNYNIPAYCEEGVDRIHAPPAFGTPIYRSQSRMSSALRFYDDEMLRSACVHYVQEHGGMAFFSNETWRQSLNTFAKKYRATHKLDERHETPQEQQNAIYHSLKHSKDLIEKHLPNTSVRHLCYPWHKYSILAASIAREVGYESAFVAYNSQKLETDWSNPYRKQNTLPINEYGDDPYQITRIDSGDDLILSLPGKNRLTYSQRFGKRLLRSPQFLRRRA